MKNCIKIWEKSQGRRQGGSAPSRVILGGPIPPLGFEEKIKGGYPRGNEEVEKMKNNAKPAAQINFQ